MRNGDKRGRDKRLNIRTGDNPAGRVEFDRRGWAIWRWEGADGEGTTTLRRRLDNDELELEPTREVLAGPRDAAASARAPTPGRMTAEKSARNAGAVPAPKAAAIPAPKPRATSAPQAARAASRDESAGRRDGSAGRRDESAGGQVGSAGRPVGATRSPGGKLELEATRRAKRGGGFDPYNSRS